MGWGTSIDWFDLFEAGCRLGIVDATPMGARRQCSQGVSLHRHESPHEGRAGGARPSILGGYAGDHLGLAAVAAASSVDRCELRDRPGHVVVDAVLVTPSM